MTDVRPHHTRGWFAPGDLDVLDVLVRRRDEGSRRGLRRDDLRVALVIEGGGMRGAYSGGMVRALEEAGLRESFDEIFGTSAGAFNAVAFATGEGAGAAAIYADDLSGTRFIDFRRPLTGRGRLIHLDYLINDVLVRSKPLDLDALSDSAVPVRPVATNAVTLAAHAFDDLRTPDDWRAALRATACIPLLAGPPVPLRDQTWIDGSVSEPVALRRALDGGATHVLTLLSRAPDERTGPVNDGGRMLTAMIDRTSPGLGRALRERPRLHAETLSVFHDAAHPLRRDARVLAVRPLLSCGVGPLTTDPARLRHAADTGSAAVHTVLATRAQAD
jgi:predicted patatin/cPLA2 family phospholipase